MRPDVMEKKAEGLKARKTNYGYVYLTTNLLMGKIYIGQNKGEFDPKYLGSGLRLKRAIRKYGRSNFKVTAMEYAKDKTTLNALEIQYISEGRSYLGKENVYNINEGGDGGHNHPHSLRTRKKMSMAATGKEKTQEHRKNIGLSQLGRKQPKDVCEKRNRSMLGKNKGKKPWSKGLTKETSMSVLQASLKRTGRKCSEATKDKIRQKKLSYKFTENHRRNIGLSGIGRKYSREVIQQRIETRRKNGWLRRDR